MEKRYPLSKLGLFDAIWQTLVGVLLFFVEIKIAVLFLLTGAISFVAVFLARQHKWANWCLLALGIISVPLIAFGSTMLLFPEAKELVIDVMAGIQSSIKSEIEYVPSAALRRLQNMFSATPITAGTLIEAVGHDSLLSQSPDLENLFVETITRKNLFLATLGKCYAAYTGTFILFAGITRILEYNFNKAELFLTRHFKKTAFVFLGVFIVARILFSFTLNPIAGTSVNIPELKESLAFLQESLQKDILTEDAKKTVLTRISTIVEELPKEESFLSLLTVLKSISLFLFACIPTYLGYLKISDQQPKGRRENIIEYGIYAFIAILATLLLILGKSHILFILAVPLVYLAVPLGNLAFQFFCHKR